MMAHDSSLSPRPRALSDETITVLRTAVLGHLREGTGEVDALGSAVARVVAEAR